MGYLIAVSAGCPFAVTTVFVPAELGFYKRESAQSAVDRINAAISRAEAAEAALAQCQRERDDLREQVAAMNWQPIETAPEDTMVLVYSDGFGWALAHKLLGSGKPWTMYIAGQPMLLQPLLKWHPTHWMPLPETPKA